MPNEPSEEVNHPSEEADHRSEEVNHPSEEANHPSEEVNHRYFSFLENLRRQSAISRSNANSGFGCEDFLRNIVLI